MRLCTLVLALISWVSLTPAAAQPARTVPTVGYLGSANEQAERRDAFLRGLRDLGHVPGENVLVEVRGWATEGQLRQALNEFVRLKTSVIFVGPPPAARMAQQVSKDIPIVCGTCGDPVDNGLAASLARPTAATLKALVTTGHRLGLEMPQVEIRRASEFEHAFREAARRGAGAVVVQDDPLVLSSRTQIADLALTHRLPVSSGIQELTDAGGLISYGPDRVDLWRRAAAFVDKILNGAKPADLPFEQPTKLDFVFNLKTARALGIRTPDVFVVRATRVIE